MTLRRRLTLQIGCMLAGVAMLGIAGVLGMSALHTDLSISLRANEQLRYTYTVGVKVAGARAMAEREPASPRAAADELEGAADLLEAYGDRSADRWIDGTEIAAANVGRSLRRAASELKSATAETGGSSDITTAFAVPYGRLANLVAATRQAVAERQVAADQKQRWAIFVMSALAASVMGGAITIGVRQYRSVLRPMNDARASARRIASGHFHERVAVDGDEEFAALAADFNRMAADLQTMYAELEQRIAVKSRELAQSERLASVGYLAAGVAHEINNPLGIITGHGERSLMRLERGLSAETTPKFQDSLRIICDEAFRCKKITDGLLALARPGDEARVPVPLDRLILQVVGTLSALPRFKSRETTFQADASIDWSVRANETQLRQVVLNVTVNALEATASTGGRVHMTLSKSANTIELRIADNGKGMTANSLSSIFEPFYTEKRGDLLVADGHAGTGLGLSIAHSIVASLGGAIRAQSDGVGLGSTFTVSLPAADMVSIAEGGADVTRS